MQTSKQASTQNITQTQRKHANARTSYKKVNK